MDTFSQKQTLFNYFSEMQIHRREGEEPEAGGRTQRKNKSQRKEERYTE